MIQFVIELLSQITPDGLTKFVIGLFGAVGAVFATIFSAWRQSRRPDASPAE
jgi:hypothetical protein